MRSLPKSSFFLLLLSITSSLIWMPPAITAQDGDTAVSFLPSPTGPYQVGKTTRYWIDESRDELFTPDETDHRELMVRIWYPAEVGPDAVPARYLEDLSGPMGAEAYTAWGLGDDVRNLGFSSPEIQNVVNAYSHAYTDVPIAGVQTKYPVLLLSPGSQDLPEDYSIQTEELASHGYVVVGISHPYYSGETVFPDGRLVAGISFSFGIKRQAETTIASDVIFSLDQMELLNTSDPEGLFTQRLDLTRVGVFGHSLGGWAVVLAGSLDSRISAVLNEDGGILPDDYHPLEQPYMLFTTQSAHYPSKGPNYVVWCRNFGHRSFTDAPVWPVDATRVGSLEGTRTVEIVRGTVLVFFDNHVKGESTMSMEDVSSMYSEIKVVVTGSHN